MDRGRADAAWARQQQDKIPDKCPHGYGPVKVEWVDFQTGWMAYPEKIPGTYDCPDHCPEKL